MATLFIILKIGLLLGIIIVPLTGPRDKNASGLSKSNLAVNNDGQLEFLIDSESTKRQIS